MKKLLSIILVAAMMSAAALAQESGQSGTPEGAKTESQENNASVENANKEEAKVEVYNLCGQYIGNSLKGLPKGVYIVKQDGASRKWVVR